MLTVNIHDAKTRLSELIARAVKGEPFVIAKAGKPMVKVTAIDAPEAKKPQRLGFADPRQGTGPVQSHELSQRLGLAARHLAGRRGHGPVWRTQRSGPDHR